MSHINFFLRTEFATMCVLFLLMSIKLSLQLSIKFEQAHKLRNNNRVYETFCSLTFP